MWQPSVPGEPPPNTIVVREYIAAWASLPLGKSGSVVAATGVSGESVSSSSGTPYRGAAKTAWITRYSVKHSAQSFTLTCAPEASASYPDTGQYPTQYWGSSSNVTYALEVAYPQIKLGGGKGGVGSELLIGQRLVAHVPPILDLVQPANGATPGFQWSTEGNADPFKEFHVELNQDNVTSIGEKRQPTAFDLKSSQFKICFAKPGAATVRCATLHLAVPPGALPTTGIDVDLDPVQTTISAPLDVERVVVAKGTVILDPPETRGGVDYPGRLRLGGNNGTTYARPTGINYRSNITTPQAYWQAVYNGNFVEIDTGGFRWVQVVTLGTSRTLSNGVRQNEVCGPAALAPGVYWNRGLDTFYPYAPSFTEDVSYNPPNTVYVGDGWGLMYRANGGSRDANGNLTGPGEAGDTPGRDLNRQDAASGGTASGAPKVDGYLVRDDFTTYQLYRPPGDGSQFVPVQSFHWYWGGSVGWSANAPGGGAFLNHTLPPGRNVFDSITSLSSTIFPNFLWDRLVYGRFTTFRNQVP